MSKILIFHRGGILLKVRNLHLCSLRFVHLHEVWFKLLTTWMICVYNLLGSAANTGPMVLWTTAISHIVIHGFRCFALILEVLGLGSEVWALLGFVSSLGWALTLLTLVGWLLAAPTTYLLASWVLISAIMCFRHSSSPSRSSLMILHQQLVQLFSEK